MKNKRVLITSCADAKKNGKNMPAVELYDGPAYRIMRKHHFPPENTHIISAKYNLIRGDTQISNYDQRMTAKRAAELSIIIEKGIKDIIKQNPSADIFVNLGRTYTIALGNSETTLRNHNATFAKGRIGERLHQLKMWLTEE